MNENSHYPFNQVRSNRYTFISTGKRPIEKVVEFKFTGWGKIINMGFGDVRPDGTIDDKAISNNGDLVMVLGTTIAILKEFTSKFPDAEIFFIGSTQIRTRLYARIIRNYSREFAREFIISVLIKEGEGFVEIPFEAKTQIPYIGFLIRRIS